MLSVGQALIEECVPQVYLSYMKAVVSFAFGAVCFVSGCAHQQNVTLAPTGPKAAVVRDVKGGSAKLIGSNETRSAKMGTVIAEGETLQTSKTAQAEILLGDAGPTVRLAPDTAVRFGRSATDPDLLELDLKRGRVIGSNSANADGMSEGVRYMVKTPKGFMAPPPSAEDLEELRQFKRDVEALEN